MQSSRDQKISEDIHKLILSINPSASESFQQNIKSYAKKVLSSNSSSKTYQKKQTLELKDKIIAKVSNTQDNKAVIHCQQSISRLMQSTNVQKKNQILAMLLRCSQINQNHSSNFSGVFKDQKQNLLNQTQQTLHTSKLEQAPSQIINRSSLSFLKSKRPSTTADLSGIRNRGNDSQGISQADILKQITYVLQNIHSNYIDKDKLTEIYTLRPNINVSETVRKMVSELSDIGWLFKKITASVSQRGSITKALAQAVREQMSEYYRWLAVLENMIKQNELSLRRLAMWSYQPLQKLKWLAMILQAAMPYNGCQIISIINSFRPQGHIMISQLLNRLLSHLVQPFLQYIYHWIYKGQLIDDQGQYFISQQKKISDSEQWLQKYRLLQQNIPNIIDRQAALMIFNSGKTIYFLKNQCQYSYHPTVAFIEPRKILNNQISADSSNILSAEFTNWLKNVSANVNQELVSVLFNHFDLKYHLQSMKNFYLMGKGDFIQHLIDNLGQQMSKAKHQIYEHTLDGYISDGLTKCFNDFKIKKPQSKYINQKVFNNNSYRSNIIDRLLAKKVQYGKDSWDCFNFQYGLDRVQPVRTLLSPSAMKNYQKIFHFLWKVKRIQQTLKEVWLSHLKNYPNKNSKGKFEKCELSQILHRCHLLGASMCHFLTNLYSYLMIAIQSKWNEFMQKVDKTQSFDEILKLHMQLQEQLLDITLNTQSKKNRLSSLMTIFQSIVNFKTLEEQLKGKYNDYYQKCRNHQNRRLISQRSLIQLSGDYELPMFQGAKITKDLAQAKNLYNDAFKRFYQELKKQSQNKNGNVLFFRLDFSEYYSFEYEPQL